MSENLLNNIVASSIVLAAFLVVIGVVFTVISYMKMRKKRQYFEQVHQELSPDQEVMFGGGIYGRIKKVKGDRVDVTVSDGVVLEVSRYAIQAID